MLQPWRIGTVIDIIDVNASTKRFWIEISELSVFDFIPGQFVTLDLPIHEQKNKRWRSYSIASSPDGTNIIELIIVLLPNGAGTTYLFNDVKIGSQLSLRGPIGVFTLPKELDKDIFLICTGTGVAPFRSMVKHIHQHKIEHKDIHLIFGCRKYGDTLYEDELMELQQQEQGFYYHPAFSREETIRPGAYAGYVHAVYEQLIQQNKTDARFYLCGWKNMVDEAKERIVRLGYDKHAIHLELYG